MKPWLLISIGLLLAGCEKHMQGMYDQPRYKPLAQSPLWQDGGASRESVPGTEVHARGDFSDTSSGRIGEEQAANRERDENARTNPYAVTSSFLQHGRERFGIYCEPCHSPVGDGDGFIVRRGFPAPSSFHSERLRAADDRHYFDVITQGYGAMYSYADRVPPADRWAIVAYIRALQLSQHVERAQLSAAERSRLEAAP